MNEQLQNELEEQARLLGMSAKHKYNLRGKIWRLEVKLAAERALADRLAEELESLAWLLWGHERPNTTVTLLRHRLQQALAAWKEARHD